MMYTRVFCLTLIIKLLLFPFLVLCCFNKLAVGQCVCSYLIVPHVMAWKILSDDCIMELFNGDYKEDLIPESDFNKS
jgi:hypothetical protein